MELCNIKAKTILSKVKYGDEWYGVNYNIF